METINKLKVIINADTQQYDQALTSAANKIQSFSKAALVGLGIGGASIGAVMVGAIKQTAEFEKQFARLTTLIKTGSMDTDALRAQYLKLGDGVGDVTEIVKAAYSALSGNVAPAKSVQFMADVVRFAKGNMIEFDAATKTVVGVLNTFGNKAGNTREILDALTRTIQIGQMTGQQYADSIGPILAKANSLGITFKDLNATLTALTASNININNAVTYLGALLTNVAKPSKAVRDLTASLGIEFSQAALQSNGLGGFISDLIIKLRGNEKAIISLFGNIRAYNAVAVLTSKEGGALLLKNQNEIANSAGAMVDAYQKVKDTLIATIDGIRNAIKAQAISSTLPVVEEIKKILLENRKAIVDTVGAIIGAMAQVTKIFLQFHDVIILAGKAFVLYFIASKAGGAIGGIGLAVGKLIEHVTKLTTAYVAQGVAGEVANAKTTSSMKSLTSQFPALFANVKGISGLLSNLGPLALAAFGGWELGKLINDTMGLGNAIQGVVDKLQLTVAEQEKLSKVSGFGIEKFNEALEAMQGFGVDQEINKIAASFGVIKDDILATTTAVYNNRDAFNALSPAAQEFLRAAEGFDAYAKSTAREELRKSILAIGESLGVTTTRITDSVMAIRNNEQAYRGLNEQQKEFVDKISNVTIKIRDNKKAADELTGTINDNSEAISKLKDDLGILDTTGLQENAANINGIMSLYSQYKSRIEGNNQAIEKWIKKIDELSEGALPGELQALKELREEILSLKDNTEEITKLNDDLLNQITKASEKLAGSGFVSKLINQDEYRKLIDESLVDWENYTGKMTAMIMGMAGIWPGVAGAIVAENNRMHYQLRVEISKSQQSLENLKNSLVVTGEALSVMGDIFGALSEVFPEFQNQLGGAGQAMNSLGGISNGFSKILEGGFSAATGGIMGIISALPGLISGLKKLFAGDGIGQAAERLLSQLPGVTNEWKKEIEDLAKSLTGAETAERAFNETLVDIIDNAEITTDNFSFYAQKVNDIVSAFERGSASLAETQKNFNAAFDALLKKARELGMESDSWIFQLRELALKFGLNIDSIQEQLKQLTQEGADGFRKMKEALDVTNLRGQLDDLYAELNDLENPPSPERYNELIESIKILNGEIETLNDLSALFKKNTFSQFEEIYSFEEKVTKNKKIVDAIKGWGEQMAAFTKINKISEADFQGYMDTIAGEMDALKKAGFSDLEILKVMGDQLSQINFLAGEYKFTLPPEMKKLIEEGLKTGDVTVDFRSENQKVVDGLIDLGSKLDRIAGLIEEGNSKGGGGNIPGFATGTGGMYVNTPSIFAVAEGGRPEIVQFSNSGSQMKVTPVTGGGGQQVSVNISITAVDARGVRDFVYSTEFQRYITAAFGQRGLRG